MYKVLKVQSMVCPLRRCLRRAFQLRAVQPQASPQAPPPLCRPLFTELLPLSIDSRGAQAVSEAVHTRERVSLSVHDGPAFLHAIRVP